MASIIKKKIRGQIYYYAVESKRVNGKPRIVWQKYLGKVADIIKAVNGMENLIAPETAKVYEFGVEAALLAIARRLDLVEIINNSVEWKGEGLSPGEHILLYAINVSVAPGERLSVWYERTMLRHHIHVASRALTEKRFLGVGELLNPGNIQKIQVQLSQKIIDEFGLGPGALVYSGIKLPGTSGSRPRKGELGASYTGILATAEFAVPLFYEIYSGEAPDEDAVEKYLGTFADRYCSLGYSRKEVTVVENGLNRSMVEMLRMPGEKKLNRFLYVLEPGDHHRDFDVPLERFHLMRTVRTEKTKVFRTSKKIGESKVAVLVVYSENEFNCQMEEIRGEIQTCFNELRNLKKSLEDEPEIAGLSDDEKQIYYRKRAEKIVDSSSPHIRSLIEISFPVEAGSRLVLDYQLNDAYLAYLRVKLLGRRVLVTDNAHWENEEIYGAYSGRTELEEAINRMRLSPDTRPAQKNEIQASAHTFCLMLALTMQSLLRRELHRCGVTGNLSQILKLLSEMREVSVTYAKGETRFRRKEYSTIAELDSKHKEIYDCLHLEQFVEGGESED